MSMATQSPSPTKRAQRARATTHQQQGGRGRKRRRRSWIDYRRLDDVRDLLERAEPDAGRAKAIVHEAKNKLDDIVEDARSRRQQRRRGRPSAISRPLAARIRHWRFVEMKRDSEIVALLEAEGVPTPRGGLVWRPSSIQRLLARESPRGTARIPVGSRGTSSNAQAQTAQQTQTAPRASTRKPTTGKASTKKASPKKASPKKASTRTASAKPASSARSQSPAQTRKAQS
jgi:hypothetical protein